MLGDSPSQLGIWSTCGFGVPVPTETRQHYPSRVGVASLEIQKVVVDPSSRDILDVVTKLADLLQINDEALVPVFPIRHSKDTFGLLMKLPARANECRRWRASICVGIPVRGEGVFGADGLAVDLKNQFVDGVA